MSNKCDHSEFELENTYSVFEVAKRHRTTSKTTRNEIERGRLKVIYVGRLLRITPEALFAYERGDWKYTENSDLGKT